MATDTPLSDEAYTTDAIEALGASRGVRDTVADVYRDDSRHVLATLIRLLGDFDLAEEALHDAFTAALEQWERDGIPRNPRSWLVSTGRFKAIDRIRRRSKLDETQVESEIVRGLNLDAAPSTEGELADRLDDDSGLHVDDRLRLIFTCCHPALSPEARIALTLRAVCDLTTEVAELISEGVERVERALTSRRFGPFTLQAAIAAVHAEAPSVEETDWAQVVALYDLLLRIDPSPVIELNRAVALAMRDGAEVGLRAVDELLDRGELDDYHLAHATRADLCRRLGRRGEAAASFRRAAALANETSQRRFLEARLAEVTAAD